MVNVSATLAPLVAAVQDTQSRKKAKPKKKRHNKKKKSKRQSRRTQLIVSRQIRLANPGIAEFERAYIDTLNDPFEYPGVHLGFGCLVPTVLAFAYARGSFAANADGSFIVGAQPALGTSGNFTGGSNSGATAAVTYGYGASANATNLSSFNYARVVSGGLRVRVGQALTAAPGMMVGFAASTAPSTTLSSSNTPTQCINLPQAEIAWGSETMQVLWRPRDSGDFDFGPLGTTPNASGEMYVSGTGFPASVTVFYEAVFHIECFTTFLAGTVDQGNLDSGVAGGFDTLQALAKIVKRYGAPVVASTIQQAFGLNSKFGKQTRTGSARPGFMTLDALDVM